MGLQLWIPRSARPKWQCRVPGCDAEFYEGELRQYEAHVARCAADHHDELMARKDRERPPAFFQPHDPEYYEWARTHGRPF
jgi:hypothetical protein